MQRTFMRSASLRALLLSMGYKEKNMTDKNFKVGDKVVCNGNKEAKIVEVCVDKLEGMYIVRLWDGSRRIGEACVSGKDLGLLD